MASNREDRLVLQTLTILGGCVMITLCFGIWWSFHDIRGTSLRPGMARTDFLPRLTSSSAAASQNAPPSNPTAAIDESMLTARSVAATKQNDARPHSPFSARSRERLPRSRAEDRRIASRESYETERERENDLEEPQAVVEREPLPPHAEIEPAVAAPSLNTDAPPSTPDSDPGQDGASSPESRPFGLGGASQ